MDSNDSAAVSTYTLGCAYMSAIIDSNCGHLACITKRRRRLWRSNTSSSSIGSPNAIRYAGDLYGTGFRIVGCARRSRTHVNADWDVKLFRKLPEWFEPRVLGRDSFVLRGKLAECLNSPGLKLFAEPRNIGKICHRTEAGPSRNGSVPAVARKNQSRNISARIRICPFREIIRQTRKKHVTQIQCGARLRRRI